MADNVQTSAGTADGAVFAADDIGPGVYYPRVKITLGADGTNDGDVASGNPMPVTVPASATSIAKAEDAVHASGDVGVQALSVRKDTAAATSGTDGDYQPLITDANGRLHVLDQNSAAGLTALQLIDNSSVDHDAASVNGVIQVGLVARTTDPTAVSASGDATKALATSLGKQVTLPYAIPAASLAYAGPTGGVTDTADDAAFAAAGVGIRNYVTGVQVINGHATVSTEVVIKDGSTIIWRGFAQAAGGGCAAKFDPPLRGTANTAINVTNITTGSATYFNLQGYTSAE